MAFIVMGVAYFIAGVIPGLLIRERQYDPQQSSLATDDKNDSDHQLSEHKSSVKPVDIQ